MKKVISLFAAVCMLLSATCMQAFAAAPSFSDVPADHWAYDAVEYAADKGWIDGVGNGRSDPSGAVTGAQWTTMVMRAFFANTVGELQPGDPWYQPYKDAAEHWMIVDINWSFEENNMINPITRYNMADIIFNSLLDKDKLPDDIYNQDHSQIGDWDQIPDRHRVSVANAYSMGILTGVNDNGDFCGDQYMTRAQAAVVLQRMDNVINGGM